MSIYIEFPYKYCSIDKKNNPIIHTRFLFEY